MVSIDTSAVSRITGVSVGNFNMWVQRGLIPNVVPGTQGRAREFDLSTVFHIAVMSVLTDLGYGASFAAMAAAESVRKGAGNPGARLIIGPMRRNVYNLATTPTIDVVLVKTPKDVDAFLDSFVGGRPVGFTIIELDRLFERVRKAFLEPDMAERAKRQRGVPERRSGRRDMMEPAD